MDSGFLESLRTEVRTNHPTVAAARARLRAAESAVRGVRLWEDPMAGFGVLAAEEEMRRDNGDLVMMAEQALPRRRLYEARRAQASAERARYDAETRSAALELEVQVAQVTIEMAMLDEMIAIEKRQLAWLESMAANARERLKDPMGNASEPLRIERARDVAEHAAGSETAQTAFVEQLFHHVVNQPALAYGADTLRQLREAFERAAFDVRALLVDVAVVGALEPETGRKRVAVSRP